MKLFDLLKIVDCRHMMQVEYLGNSLTGTCESMMGMLDSTVMNSRCYSIEATEKGFLKVIAEDDE